MAVSIVALEGGSKSNSYATINEADEYLNELIGTEDWRSLTDEEKARYLITASKRLDRLPFQSDVKKNSSTQKMLFPILGELNTTSTNTTGTEVIQPETTTINATTSTLKPSATFTSIYDSVTGFTTLTELEASLWKEANTPLTTGWTKTGTNTYKGLQDSSPQDLICSIDSGYVENGDTIGFSVRLLSHNNGTVTLSIGGSTDAESIRVFDGTDVGFLRAFTLKQKTLVNEIRLKPSALFDGTIEIVAVKQTEIKYYPYFDLIGLISKDRVYTLTTKDYIAASDLSIMDGTTELVKLVSTSAEATTTFNSGSEVLKFVQSGFGNFVLNYKMDEKIQTDGFILMKEATIIEAMYLVDHYDDIEMAKDSSIVNHSKDNFGHGTVEKAFTGFNPYKEIAPGIIRMLSSYVSTSFTIKRS